MGMRRTVFIFIAAQVLIFGVAALMHGGWFGPLPEHDQAGVAEGVIAAALLAGFCLMGLWPNRLRAVALGAQGIALLGTLLGAVMIAIGAGPQSAGDVALHALTLVVLGAGLVRAWRISYAISLPLADGARGAGGMRGWPKRWTAGRSEEQCAPQPFFDPNPTFRRSIVTPEPDIECSQHS